MPNAGLAPEKTYAPTVGRAYLTTRQGRAMRPVFLLAEGAKNGRKALFFKVKKII